MGGFNKNTIDFTREVLVDKITRTIPGIALYYQNVQSTNLAVQVTSSQIIITYISSTSNISYANKTLEDVCAEINQLTYPIKAVALIDNLLLTTDSFITQSNKTIPLGFSIHDRSPGCVLLRTKLISIKHKADAQIKILPPYAGPSTNPWYPRLTIGSFSIKKNNKVYYFGVPEYNLQTWSSKYGKPFRDVEGEVPTIVSSNVIKVSRTPILWNEENIIIFKKDTPLSTNNILDVDTTNGLIYLSKNLPVTEDLTINYSYKEETYEYKALNLNAHFSQNPTIIGKFVVIYLLAHTGLGFETRKETVRHVIGDSVLQAIDSIAVDNDTPISIIGAYSIQQVYSSDKVKILDTRSLGGGLVDIYGPKNPNKLHDNILNPTEDSIKIEDKFTEAGNFWDIGRWDGEIYPGAAAVLVDIPTELKEVLNVDEIKKRAAKFIAAGVQPLFEFSDRELPDVSSYSSQVSCFLPITGISGYFWAPTQYDLPDTLLEEDDVSITKDAPISVIGDSFHLSPVSNTGVYQYYLKSTPIAGIEWEERSYQTNTNSLNGTKQYSEWIKKRIYDTRSVENKGLIKGVVYFPPTNVGKEYRNIKVHSPYRKSWANLDLSKFFTDFYKGITGYRQATNSVDIVTEVTNDEYSLRQASDYIGISPVYSYVYDLMNSSLSGSYTNILDNINTRFQDSFTEDIEYILNYSVNVGGYRAYEITQSGLDLTPILVDFSKIANVYKTINFASYDNILKNTTGLLNNIQSNLDKFIPVTYKFDPITGYIPNDLLLGPDLGYSSNEINDTLNPDSTKLNGCVGVSATSLLLDSITGSLASTYSVLYQLNYDTLISYTEQDLTPIQNITYNNTPVLDTWYNKHDRLGETIGKTLNNLITSYEYIRDAQVSNTRFDSLVEITGIDADSLHDYFIRIEDILLAQFDLVKEILYKGGIMLSFDKIVFAYGWYYFNWNKHYRIYPRIPLTDYKDQFFTLYKNGVDIVLKSIITSEGYAVDTTIIDNNPASFAGQVPSSVFNMLRVGISLPDIKAKLAALYNTISGQYFIDNGFCYTDPRKITNSVGKEIELSKDLALVYRDLNPKEDTNNYWDYLNSDLNNLRGLIYYPVVTGNNAISKGIENPLGIWKFYNSGNVASQLSYLRNAGCNAIKVPLDYYTYLTSGNMFNSHLNHLAEQCSINRLHLVPLLWNNEGSNFSGYSFYYTGANSGLWKSIGDDSTNSSWFSVSGKAYITNVVSVLENYPCTLSYEIINDYSYTNTESASFVTDSAAFVKTLTNLPTMVGLKDINTQYSNIYSSSSIDYIGLPYSGIFNKSLSNSIKAITGLTDKSLYITKPSYNIYQNIIDDVESMSSNNIGGFISFAYDSITGNKTPGVSGRSLLYTNGECKTVDFIDAIQALATDQDSLYTYTGINLVSNLTGKAYYPSEYLSDINREYILRTLKNWQRRSNIYPLYSGTYDLNEFIRQYQIINVAHSSLDQFNDTINSYIPEELKILSDTQKQTLNYYRNNFDGNFLVGQTTWTSNGQTDWQRYGDYFTNWGSHLWSIIFNTNLHI